MLNAGQAAPLFDLPDMQGNTVRLKDLLAAGPVLLAFFKISCPTCQMTMPYLNRISHQPGLAPLRIYGVSQDDATPTGHFNGRFGVTFPVLLDTLDGGYAVSNAYGITHVPSLFLVETDGTIGWSGMGFSKSDLQMLADRASFQVFRPDEKLPEYRAG